jgi:NAD(P)H-nitrite reductase large subunit
MRYVIIGCSTSGVNAIKAIREVDKENEIVALSDEEKIYSRPLISYFLAGRVKEENMNFVEEDFSRKYNVKIYFSTEVKKIDTKSKTLLFGKKRINYDKLLISVGGVPIKPNIDGYDDSIKGIFTFTKLSDVRNIVKYIEDNKIKEAVVLGGGLIGMKASEGLLNRKIKIKIIELADKLLANTFDKTASEILENKLKEIGSEVIKETTIKKIVSKSKKIQEIVLLNGQKFKTKLLILAVGVKPNLNLIKDTGIKTNKGIIVNEYMETNVRDIYAAGDVCEGTDFLSNTNSVIAIWPTAAKQGRIAGSSMAGKKIHYDGTFAMNSIEILNVPSISFGITNPKVNGYEILTKREGERYKKIVLKDNKIVGVILVNNIERAGIYGLMIREKLNVSEFKQELLKDDFGFLLLPKDVRKHYVVGEGIEV